jgi:hypothetical protein
MKTFFCLISGLVCLLLCFSSSASAAFVPDTGQSICYDNTTAIACPQPGQPFYGQDAQYAAHPHSYTKLDATGAALPASAVSWSMVHDEVTGLIWENKVSADSTKNYIDPHDPDNTYTWYDSDPLTNGGNAGLSGDGTDTEDFLAALNGAVFGGYDNWRQPTVKELAALTDADFSSTMLDPDYFPHVKSDFYWSSTTWEADNESAWVLTFLDGVPGVSPKLYPANFAIAVQGTQTANSFADNGDDTVSDTAFGLMWQKVSVPDKNWQEALAYCESLELGGYTDWRLPDRNELNLIVDYTRHNPSINTTYFPDTPSSLFWSSTTKLPNPAEAFVVWFEHGYSYGLSKKLLQHVRAVRTIGSLPSTTTAPTTTVPITTVPTTTTTTAGGSTTTTTVGSTTTTIKNCPFRGSAAGAPGVQPLRQLRDSQIDTAIGAVIASMYYQNMDEISDILRDNPRLRYRFNRITHGTMPVVGRLLRQGTATIEEDDVFEMHGFLTDLQSRAGTQLHMDIDFIVRGLESGWLLQWLGIAVE